MKLNQLVIGAKRILFNDKDGWIKISLKKDN